jgi:hypothetical protein
VSFGLRGILNKLLTNSLQAPDNFILGKAYLFHERRSNRRLEMKKITVLILAFSVLTLPMNGVAKKDHGIDLIIQKTNGKRVRGELIAVKRNSLLLKESFSGADASVAVNDMETIVIVKKSKALQQGGVGFLAGGTAGLLAGFSVYYSSTFFGLLGEVESKGYHPRFSVPYGLIGAAVGTLIGVMTGAFAGQDEIIQIQGMPEVEIKKNMEELRKKARVPDFQ